MDSEPDQVSLPLTLQTDSSEFCCTVVANRGHQQGQSCLDSLLLAQLSTRTSLSWNICMLLLYVEACPNFSCVVVAGSFYPVWWALAVKMAFKVSHPVGLMLDGEEHCVYLDMKEVEVKFLS